jgi:hypothetical protein
LDLCSADCGGQARPLAISGNGLLCFHWLFLRAFEEDKVNTCKIYLAMMIAACGCLLAVACGGTAATDGDTGQLIVESVQADKGDVDALYSRIEKALDDAYSGLGKPPVDWDNMDRVHTRAFETLTSDSAEPTWGASWSMSVLDDHIAIWVSIEGAEKSGEWRP